MSSESKKYLLKLAEELDRAQRIGAKRIGATGDNPEGEQVIQVSDTLARIIAQRLREIAEEVGEAVTKLT